jgi:hypothetical protein
MRDSRPLPVFVPVTMVSPAFSPSRTCAQPVMEADPDRPCLDRGFHDHAGYMETFENGRFKGGGTVRLDLKFNDGGNLVGTATRDQELFVTFRRCP